MSPIFAVLTSSIEVMEGTRKEYLQGCGDGSKKFELSETRLEQLFEKVKKFYWILQPTNT
jgi:hypothetical protein